MINNNSTRRFALNAAVLTSMYFMLPLQVMAQVATLDLSSTQHNASTHQTGQITVGGSVLSVTPGAQLTQAEKVALYQSNHGGQTLLLGAQGQAVGGTFTVSDHFHPSTNLVIPAGVTALQTASVLNLTGNLNNSGSLIANPASAVASITAANIFNNTGALISTLNSSNSHINLVLNASNNIVNAGQILSSGNLNITAGGSIVNALPLGVTGAQPVMQALNNINILTGVNSATAQLVNSGLINALAGNINISSQSASSILVNNTAGSIMAQLGSINVRDALFTGNNDFTLNGGSIVAKALNIDSGCGTVILDGSNISGVVNMNAGAAHINTSSTNLELGAINLTGDPTFFNTAGAITINNSITTSGVDLSIIASGDVLSSNLGSIATANTNAGGNITIIAGANFTSSGPSGSTTTGAQGTGDISSTLTVTGGNGTGGQINLSSLTGFSSAAGGAGSGGNITLVAFAGSGGSSGTINTSGITGGVKAQGSGGPNGNVTYIAGATSGTAINTGNISTAGTGVGNGGQVNLLTATPVISSNLSILNGLVSTGGVVSASAIQVADISTGSIATSAAPITIVSGGNASFGGALSTGGVPISGVVGSGGNLAILAGGNISTSSSSAAINTSGGTNSAGGNVILLAGSTLSPSLTYTYGVPSTVSLTVNATGANSGGGNIDLTGGGASNMSSFTSAGNNGAAGFGGGNIQLVALSGTVTNTTGTVSFPTALTITSGGSSNGNVTSANPNQNGNVSVFAGSASGTSINIGNINTTGSNAGAGNITVATTQASTGLPLSYANGVISSGSLTGTALQPASAIAGNLTASGGSVLLPPPAGGVFTSLTTSINVQSGASLTIGSVSNANNALPAGNTPGSCTGCAGINSSTINLSSVGAMTFSPGAVISSNALTPNVTSQEGTNGGNITLSAQSYSGAVSVQANATGGFIPSNGQGGNAGNISITSTGNSASTITVGAGNFSIAAQGDTSGGNGAVISLSSGTDISIDPTVFLVGPQPGSNAQISQVGGGFALLNSGNGAQLTLTAAGNLSTSGALNANGATSTISGATGNPGGNGGFINISVNSATVFDIGSAGATPNGIQGALTANGNVGATPAFGRGGTIIVSNSGSGGIQVENGMLSVAAAAAVGGALPPAAGSYNAGKGGNITLISTLSTVYSLGPLSVNGGGSSAVTGSGSAGSITITSNSATPFVIGTPTTNGVTTSITANGNVTGSGTPPVGPASLPSDPLGSGGIINISNTGAGGISIGAGGSVSVLAAQGNSNSAAGNGGSIILNAPAGPVFSSIALSANGGAASSGTAFDAGYGGVISITSSSSTPFVVGAPTTNGITGTISANGYAGGSISLSESGSGGIQIANNALSASAVSNSNPTGAAGNGGNISINASGGPVAITGNLNVSGNGPDSSSFNFGGFGGSIIIVSNSAQALTIGSASGANFVSGTLTSNGGTANAGNGDAGIISLKNLGGDINVGSNSIVLTAPGATNSGYAGNGGFINLEAPSGNVTIAGSLSANGGAGNNGTIIFAQGLAGGISISLNSASNFNIGGASVSSLSANGWNGGTILVSNAGAGGITVGNNAISVTAQNFNPAVPPGNNLQIGQRNVGGPGGSITLTTTPGQLTINTTLDVSGGAIFAQTASAAVSSGSSVVVNVSSTQGFAVGQQVTIAGGGNTENQTITALSANTSITIGTVTNNYLTAPSISAYSLTQTATAIPVTNVNTGLTPISVSSSQGYIVGQPVLLSTSPSNSEVQFVSAVSAGTITVGQLSNTYASNPTVTAFSTPGTTTLTGGTGISQAAGKTINAGTVSLTSAAGTIGTAGTPLNVNLLSGSAVGNLASQSLGLTNIVNKTASASLQNIQTGAGAAFTFKSAGNITLDGTVNSGGALLVQNTNTTLGNVQVNPVSGVANLVSAAGAITFENDFAGGQVIVNGGNQLISTNNPITINTNSLNLGGANPINAGTATVSIVPVTPATVINLGGGVGGLNLSAAQLGSISAGTLVLGSPGTTGGINLLSALNVSSLYNLQFLQGGSGAFTGTGNTLTVGAKSLTVSAGGAANFGTVSSSGSTIQVSGTAVTLNAAFGSATDTTSLSSTTGNISGSGVLTSQALSLSTTTGNVSLLNTVLSNLTFASGGTVALSNTGNLAVNASSGGATTLTSTGSVGFNGNFTGTGALIVNGTAANTGAGVTVSAPLVTINGAVGTALGINNQGTFNAGTGDLIISSAAGQAVNISGGGNLQVSAAGQVKVTATTLNATANNVNFSGGQHFLGSAVVVANGSAQSITNAGASAVTGSLALVLDTALVNNSGSITGNPLIMGSGGAGTIANSSGNIDLKNFSSFVFNGKALAIIASGSIVNTGAPKTIDLSGAALSGGALTLIAGYNMLPATPVGGTTSPVTTQFVLGATALNPGNISLASVTINTSSTGPSTSGGSVLAVATGSINLGAITTSASGAAGAGGSVTVIGNGVTLGNVNTSAGTGGLVSISSAAPLVTGTPTLLDGFLHSGSYSANPATFGGNIALSAVNAANANISITTGGAGTITNFVGSIATSGTLAVTSGTSNFSLNTAVANLTLATGSGGASITNTGNLTLRAATVGGNLSVSSSGNLTVGAGAVLTISSGNNMSLSSTGFAANGVSITDNTTLSAGLLVGSPAFGNLTSSQIQKAGSITITTYGSNGIVFGNGDSLVSNGSDINLNVYKTGANVDTSVSGTSISLLANGGSINVFSYGQANLGIAGGTNTVIKASTLNTFQGGGLYINAYNGIRIGGTATVAALNSLYLYASNGTVDLAPGTGGTFSVGSSVGATNVGGYSTIIASGSGLKFGDNTSFTSNSIFSANVFGVASGVSLGNNVALQSGVLSAPGVVKTAGGFYLTASGNGGIVGGNNDSIVVEGYGSGMVLSAVGVAAPITLLDKGHLQADGGSISLYSTGKIQIGIAAGTAAPGLVTTAISGFGGAISITATNGLSLGDNTQNSSVGGMVLYNYGSGGNNDLSIGAGSTTNVTGFATIGQFGLNSELIIGNGATFKASGFTSVIAYGVKAAKTIELGTTVDFESTGSGINISSSGVGSFTVGNGSTIKAGNGGINVYSAGAVALGTGAAGVTVTSTGPAGMISFYANSFALNGSSALTSGAGLSLYGASPTGGITFAAGAVTTVNGVASITSLGSVGVNGGTGSKLIVNGPILYLYQYSANGDIKFDDAQIQVNNGSLFAYSLGKAIFGTAGGAGAQISASGSFSQINITGSNNTFIGGNSVLTAGGSVSLTNLGINQGSLQVANGSQITASNGSLILSNFNAKADIQLGNSIQLKATSATLGSISITGTGVNSANANNGISFGTSALLSSSNVVGIAINEFNPTGKITIGDNFNLKALGTGPLTISNQASGANSLSLGIVNGNALGVAQSGGIMNISSYGDLFVGAGGVNAGSSMNVSSLFGAVTVSNAVASSGTSTSISSSTGTTINNAASISSGTNLTVSATSFTTAAVVNIGIGVQLSAGVLQGVIPVPPILLPANVKSAGILTISSGGGANSNVLIGNNNGLTSNGNNLQITATNGLLQIGTGNTFAANGGNLQILAKGTVTGGTGNSFTANAVGASAASSTGGGLEIGSGLTFSSNIAIAFSKPPGTNPLSLTALGNGVLYTGNVGGVIQANVSGTGAINLSPAFPSVSTLNLNKGVQVFDALGNGSSVTIDQGTFQTNALKPIAFLTPLEGFEPDSESLATLPVSIKRSSAGLSAVAVGRHGAELHAFNADGGNAVIVPVEHSAVARGKHVAQIIARPRAQFKHSQEGDLHLTSGELFVNASNQLRIKTEHAEVQVLKGALASVRAEDGCTYVRVCSSSGTVNVNVNGKLLSLNSGEELLVANHKPDDSEIHPADGLGRRNTHTVACGDKYVSISDFSILSMVSNHETLFALHNSSQSADRRLLDSLA